MASASLVLMAHDVHGPGAARRATREAGLSVPGEVLVAAVQGLRERGYRFVALHEFMARRKEGGVALLTFDDGYRSLYDEVRPRLLEHGIPALCFLVSECLRGPSDPFPLWLYGLQDAREELSDEQRRHVEANPGIQAVMRASGRNSLDELLATPAREIYLLFYPRLAYPQLDEVRDLVSELDVLERATLLPEQVLELQASGLLEFGAHSVSHRCLRHVTRAEARREVVESCRAIGALLGREGERLAFSYPYGEATPAARRVVKRSCAAGFITAERSVAGSDSDSLLPRLTLDETLLDRIDGSVPSQHRLARARERRRIYAAPLTEPLRRLKRRVLAR